MQSSESCLILNATSIMRFSETRLCPAQVSHGNPPHDGIRVQNNEERFDVLILTGGSSVAGPIFDMERCVDPKLSGGSPVPVPAIPYQWRWSILDGFPSSGGGGEDRLRSILSINASANAGSTCYKLMVVFATADI